MKAVLVCNIMHALWCWTDYWSGLLLQETWWEHRDLSKTRAVDRKENKKKINELKEWKRSIWLGGTAKLCDKYVDSLLWVTLFKLQRLIHWVLLCTWWRCVILHDAGVVVTPEVMNHIEVANLWEKPSYSFSVVLAVSNRSGPAHKNNFSHNTGQKNTKAFICRNNGKNMRRVFKQRLGHNLWS